MYSLGFNPFRASLLNWAFTPDLSAGDFANKDISTSKTLSPKIERRPHKYDW